MVRQIPVINEIYKHLILYLKMSKNLQKYEKKHHSFGLMSNNIWKSNDKRVLQLADSRHIALGVVTQKDF